MCTSVHAVQTLYNCIACVRLYYNLQFEYNAISKYRHLDGVYLFLLSYALQTKLHNSATTVCHLPHGISHLLIITLFVIVLCTCYTLLLYIKAYKLIWMYFELIDRRQHLLSLCVAVTTYDVWMHIFLFVCLFVWNELLLSHFLICRLYVISCH